MATVLKIAWRSIWRNWRRTLISMSAVGVGLLLVIVYSGVLAGLLGDAKDQLDNIGMGHVEITAAGWRAHRGASESMASPAALLGRLANVPAGYDARALFALEPHYLRASEAERNPRFPPLPGPPPTARIRTGQE